MLVWLAQETQNGLKPGHTEKCIRAIPNLNFIFFWGEASVAIIFSRNIWTLTKKIVHKLQVAQRAMERKILGLKITDKIPNEEISMKTNILNIIKHITNTKWRWAGHVARMQDNRWTIRTTEWQVWKGRRPRGRPKMRWKDDIMKWQGATWTRTAKDRKKWKELTEGYFQQWRDTA